MPIKPQFPIRIFYDGSCLVCATEIEHYLRRNHGGRLVAIDISSVEFDPQPFNIPPDAFMYEMHVIDQRGEIYRGVEAFWAIWQAFPASTFFGALGTIINMPVINPLARLLYMAFARLRQHLPKKRNNCDSACRLNKRG